MKRRELTGERLATETECEYSRVHYTLPSTVVLSCIEIPHNKMLSFMGLFLKNIVKMFHISGQLSLYPNLLLQSNQFPNRSPLLLKVLIPVSRGFYLAPPI